MLPILHVLKSPLIESLGWALVHFVWQGALLAGLIAMILFALKKSSSQTRYLAECAMLIVMVHRATVFADHHATGVGDSKDRRR
ncbi:MAG: hypothetical protein FJ267_02625 [Planctomycetes bacterium]|nr:hypothetical protein [Planctomycetota bacterium]